MPSVHNVAVSGPLHMLIQQVSQQKRTQEQALELLGGFLETSDAVQTALRQLALPETGPGARMLQSLIQPGDDGAGRLQESSGPPMDELHAGGLWSGDRDPSHDVTFAHALPKMPGYCNHHEVVLGQKYDACKDTMVRQ